MSATYTVMERGYRRLAAAILGDAHKSGAALSLARRKLQIARADQKRQAVRRDVTPSASKRLRDRIDRMTEAVRQGRRDRKFLLRPNEVLNVWAGCLGHDAGYYRRQARRLFAEADKAAAARVRRTR